MPKWIFQKTSGDQKGVRLFLSDTRSANQNKTLEPTHLSSIFALFRLPSLKVSTLLLSGLLLYDVFWVFFSQYVFNANVMVKVATRPADNPVGAMARKLHIGKDTWGKKKFNSTITHC